MTRTAKRPLPAGRMAPKVALAVGVILSSLAVPILAIGANALTALLAVIANLLYVLAYTPLKQHSHYALHVGAVPGAIPPLLGWTAATNRIDAAGIVLFGILFLWQIPHFMAIAWICRDDYRAAGFPMLPVVEPDGVRTGQQALLYAAALMPVSIGPSVVGLAGWAYFWLALVLGVVLFGLSVQFARARTDRSARALFIATIIYLPLILAVMVLYH